MGKTAAQLQREIAQLRDELEHRVDETTGRVRSDAQTTRETLKSDVKQRLTPGGMVQRRPLTTLLVSLGSGMALGFLMPAMRDGRHDEEDDD